jgi:hypothetical protein
VSYSRDKPAREVALNTGLGNGVKSSSYGVELELDEVPSSSVPVIIDDILLRRSSSDVGVAMMYSNI